MNFSSTSSNLALVKAPDSSALKRWREPQFSEKITSVQHEVMNTFSTKQFFDKKDYHEIMIKEGAWECRKTIAYFQKERKKYFDI